MHPPSGGNPVSCQSALATIELLEQGLMDNAAIQGTYLMKELRELQQLYECIGDVRGKGLMVGVEFVTDRENKEPAREWRNQIIKKAFPYFTTLSGKWQPKNLVRGIFDRHVMYQVYFYIEKLIVWPIQSYIALNWSFVSKITNLKHQITNKSQIPIFNDQNLPG